MATLNGGMKSSSLIKAFDSNAPAVNIAACDISIDTFTRPRVTPFPVNRSYTNTRPKNDALISPEPRLTLTLNYFELNGVTLWEKIIITPRTKDAGMVAGQTQWLTNVWSAFRRVGNQLTDITVSAPGDLILQNPYTLPLDFAPQQSRDFVTIITPAGNPRINGIVLFVFTGVAGTDETITGLRLAVFSLDPDWVSGVSERTQYLTEILTAFNQTEQRYALRKTPRTALRYHVATLAARESAAFSAFLWRWQGAQIGMPLWMDATMLSRDALAGDLVIFCDTALIRFAPGALLLLWRDFFTVEACVIESVAADSVTLNAPLNNVWRGDGRTWVFPVITGRLNTTLDIATRSASVTEADIEFQGEVV